MGAKGSGRRGGGRCTDDMYALDIRAMKRRGLLEDGRHFCWTWRRHGERVATVALWIDGGRARLTDLLNRPAGDGAAPEPLVHWIEMTSTPCALGGRRAWWVCPIPSCGRRVAILYSSRRVFVCRHCHRLAYRSQRETQTDRLIRRAEKIKKRLGWPAGLLNDGSGKPKGMHWRTYWRLLRRQVDAQAIALQAFGAQMGMLNRKLDALHRSVKAIRPSTRPAATIR
jgi:hypothetical protein